MKPQRNTFIWTYQVIDDVEAIVVVISGVDSPMLLLSHVILQGHFVSECFLTVQTLHTIKKNGTIILMIGISANIYVGLQ